MMEQFVIVSVLIESVIETLKPIWDPTKRENLGEFLAAVGVGEVVAIAGGFDLFELVGVPLNFLDGLAPWPGVILTGLLIGRGSNYIHDILKRIRG